LLCADCDAELEKTPFPESPYDNMMARLFWGQFPIEKASAWFYYRSHSDPSKMIYDLKYHGQPLLGEDIGEQMALRHLPTGFFNDIDAIIPIPITRKRQRQRGYNQSRQVAKGISHITHLPIYDRVVKRTNFTQSQTHQGNSWERRENVREAFQLIDADKIKGKHLLIIDDIVTTGATVIACGQELAKAEGIKLSVLSIGYTKE
jgi:ComF family protein